MVSSIPHATSTTTIFVGQIFSVAANGTISAGGTSAIVTGAVLGYKFDGQSRWMYSVDGFNVNRLLVNSINQTTGALTQVQAVQLPLGAQTQFVDVRGIEVDKNDRYLYVTFMRIDGPNGVASVNNSVLMKFSINQTTGALTEVNQVVFTGHVASLALDPDNKAVYLGCPDFINNTGTVIRQFTTDGNGNALTLNPTNFFTSAGGAYDVKTIKFTR